MQEKQRRIHERIHPMDKIDIELEEIRKLMFRSIKEKINNRWRLRR